MEKPLRTAAQRNVSCHWVVGGECWRHHWDRSCAGTKPHTSFPPPLALSRSRRGVWEHPAVSDRRPGKAGVCPGVVPRLGSPPSPAGRRLPLASSLPSQPVPSPPQARGHGDLPKRLLVALGYWFQWSLPLKNLGNGYSLSLLFLETAKQHERTVSL